MTASKQSGSTVHAGDIAFRATASADATPPALVFESLAWPSLSARSRVALQYPRAGYGGAELSISASGRYAAAMLYSGQSETGYEVFALAPALRHLGGLAYVPGECDLTPPSFSPDERLVALAVERNYWWVDPNDPEPDWETPSAGGWVTWSTLYVHDIERALPLEFPLSVALPKGWCPPNDGTWPQGLHFSTPRTLAVAVPWITAEFAFDVPAPNERIVVPSPATKL
jgi:hypothetical protein